MGENKTSLLYFHQGWSDIINCLSLINYYSKIYETLFLLIREDSKKLLDFYTKNINVKKIYVKKENLDNNIIGVLKYLKFDPSKVKMIGIGIHDKLRNDTFNNVFNKSNKFFVNRFYECYDIPYETRINFFEFKRNFEIEQKCYNNFVSKHGKEYTLIHEDTKRNVTFEKNLVKGENIVNLHFMSDTFFDYIKILENATEFHLIDSIWANFIYILDCKLKLFRNKKIFVYLKRQYTQMFTEPLKLKNWKLI